MENKSVEGEIKSAEDFLKAAIDKDKWGNPFGLNRLPYVLYEAVAKVMDEYKNQFQSVEGEQPLQENAETYVINFADWISKYYGFDYKKEAWFNLCDLMSEEPLTTKELFKEWQSLQSSSAPLQDKDALQKAISYLQSVTIAANRMRDNYSEGDEKVKNHLWKDLHTKADEARDYLLSLLPLPQVGESPFGEVKEEIKVEETKDNA